MSNAVTRYQHIGPLCVSSPQLLKLYPWATIYVLASDYDTLRERAEACAVIAEHNAQAFGQVMAERDALLAERDTIHLNPPGNLPPVDCPLLIKLDDGQLVEAQRTGFIENRSRQMDYLLADGTPITGRFPWTYP